MIKVLIVDDSVFFCTMLKNKLSEFDDIEVVGTAVNAYEARDKILELSPDIMTLDIEMPRMDGVQFLKKLLPQYNIPVIVVSSIAAKKSEAERAGARCFRLKPDASKVGDVDLFVKKLANDIRRFGGESQSVTHAELPHSSSGAASSSVYSKGGVEIIALGASTGGTDALEAVISKLPGDCPPVIVTQHMPPVFTKMYAQRLDKSCALRVCEAVDGMRLDKGVCVIAEGGKHMELCRDTRGYYITSREGEKVSGHCPSVDVMFRSAARTAGKAVIAALLTGMGADGAKGLLELKKAGAFTIGQDKDSCVVYGMPMEAYKMGAVCKQAPLDSISSLIINKMMYTGQ